MKIKISGDQIDEIVRKDLINTVDYLLRNSWEYDRNYQTTYDMIKSVIEVLSYYSTEDQMSEFFSTRNGRFLELSVKMARHEIRKRDD
jgi:hypothetical protein